MKKVINVKVTLTTCITMIDDGAYNPRTISDILQWALLQEKANDYEVEEINDRYLDVKTTTYTMKTEAIIYDQLLDNATRYLLPMTEYICRLLEYYYPLYRKEQM